MNKFLSTVPLLKVRLCLRLSFQKSFFLFFGEQVIAAINRLIPDSNLRHVAEWTASTASNNVFAVNQVGVDMRRGRRMIVFKDDFLRRGIAVAETHNDAMNVCFLRRFAIPDKRPPSEINMRTAFEQRSPQIGDCSPLR